MSKKIFTLFLALIFNATHLISDDIMDREIKHVVVVMMENRSFDNLYGLFPGATGIADALASTGQFTELVDSGVSQ